MVYKCLLVSRHPMHSPNRRADPPYTHSAPTPACVLLCATGDAHTAELYMALKSLTGGALHSEYMASDSLTNTHTLAPMTSEQLDACIARSAAGTSPVPNSHRAEPPCPPEDRNLAYHWEDNRFHRLRNLVWTQKLTELEQVNHYRTLVLGTGSQLWRQRTRPPHRHRIARALHALLCPPHSPAALAPGHLLST